MVNKSKVGDKMIFNLASKIARIIKINLLILFLAMFVSPMMAQNTSSSDSLYSFCGFRAGEDEKRCKTTPSQFGEDFVRARKAFRKFKDVRLTFKDGKLAEVFAAARFKNMKPNAVKKELDAICKDLAKSGILFGPCEIRGSKNVVYGHSSVGRVKISGDIEPTVRFTGKGRKTEKFHEIWVDITWDVDRIVGRANQKPIFVKTGYYSGQNISRCNFIEKVFGVKFGDNILKYIKPLKSEIESNQSLGKHFSEYFYIKPLSVLICNCDYIRFNCNTKDILQSISLIPSKKNSVMFDDFSAARLNARKGFESTCSQVKRWLDLEKFQIKEDLFEREGLVLYKAFCESRNDGICVEISCAVRKHYSGPFSGKFCIDRGEIKLIYISEEERAKEECEMVMKKLRLPRIHFKPPTTLVDAVEFFRNAAKESQVKLEIVFDYKKGDSVPVIPIISATDISFYDALKLVLDAVGYKFTASNGVIKIERK